jgi:hypothetical protein
MYTKINTMIKLSLLRWSICLTLTLALFSCKKDQEDNIAEIENTVDLSSKQAKSDELADDVDNVMNTALESVDLTGSRINGSTINSLTCPEISVSAGAFPKTVTIDFGIIGCTMPGGTTFRRGKMIILLSDSLRRPGATAQITFNNYYINGYKKEGMIRWTNQSSLSVRKWKREAINVTITSPGGASWTHNGLRIFNQVEGVSTPLDLMDDAFTITGNSTVVNAAGISRSSVIGTPLHKRRDCDHCDSGTIQYTGPNHTAVLDFGNGTCDDQAILTIDGSIIRNITL